MGRGSTVPLYCDLGSRGSGKSIATNRSFRCDSVVIGTYRSPVVDEIRSQDSLRPSTCTLSPQFRLPTGMDIGGLEYTVVVGTGLLDDHAREVALVPALVRGTQRFHIFRRHSRSPFFVG